MAGSHNHINIITAELAGNGMIVHFSDGTTTLFQTRFLYDVREHDGNVALTDMSDEELMNGFDDEVARS